MHKNPNKFMELSHSENPACGMVIVDKTMTEMVQNRDQIRNMPAAQPVAAPAISPQNSDEQSTGSWLHKHRNFTKEPLSYFGYQFTRSALATIPYGFGMAFFHHVFGLLGKAGVSMGLNEKGQELFYQKMKTVDPVTKLTGGGGAGLKAIDVFEKGAREAIHAPGIKGVVGRNMIRVANSPLNAALQIGLAFSMFRFTGGLVKGVRDKVMDEKNTEEDTKRETKNWFQTVKDMAKVNWKAEAVGTFWAALTLGFIGANVQQTTPYKKLPNEKLTTAIGRVLSRPSKLLQQAAIWAIAYSAFFEVDERIQKDVKLREGTWKGNVNSLINKPDDVIVGAPPKKDEQGNLAPAHMQPEKPKHGFFTEDPGLPRLLLRRVLPVAVGIAGYAVMKRSMYVVGGGQMRPVTDEINTVGKHMKLFGGNAFREGLATSTFGILWAATDAWGTWYDKFFTNLQKGDHAQVSTPEQQKNHAALLERLNAKEQSAGRAA